MNCMIKRIISVTSHALDPLSCHKLSHFLGPLPLSSVTYFMDRPQQQQQQQQATGPVG